MQNTSEEYVGISKRQDGMTKPEPENSCVNPRHCCLFLEVHHPFYGTYSEGLTEILVDVVVHFFDIDRYKYPRSNPECRPFHCLEYDQQVVRIPG